MARTWLQVTTGEIQAKREARERLAERRADNAAAVEDCLERAVRPALKAAAEARGWTFEETGGRGEVSRCRIVDTGTKPAYAEVSIDAANPVAILRRHPGGADGQVVTGAVRCDALDRERLAAWLDGEV